MKKELIRLGTQKPALRPHIRPILAALAGRTATNATSQRGLGRGPARSRRVVAGGDFFKEEKLWGNLVHNSMEEVINEIESDEEGYNANIDTYRIHMTGTVHTNLSKMTSTGAFPKSVGNLLQEAEEKIYEDALAHWMEKYQDLMEEHGITPEQVTYNDLYEMGLGSEAEELSEIQMEMQDNEDLWVQIQVSAHVQERPGKPKMLELWVKAGWNSSGYYTRALAKDRWAYAKSFEAPYDITDRRVLARVEKDLEKHLKAARQAVA